MKKIAIKILDLFRKYRIRSFRLRFTKIDYNNKKHAAIPLESKDKNEIVQFWDKLCKGRKIYDYKWFEIYNSIEENKDMLKYYVPDDLYYSIIDVHFTNPKETTVIDDKNLYDLMFYDITQPKTVLRRINNIYIDPHYKIISEKEAIERINSTKQVIVKQSINSEGGKGIQFWSSGGSINKLEEIINSSSNYIVQEILEQNEVLRDIHPSSLNTIRIITLLLNNEVIPLSSVLRMGVGGSKVDNASSGGVFCGISSTGHLKEKVYNSCAQVYNGHPESGSLSGVLIPGFDDCVQLVKNLAPRLSRFSQLISWDLSIDKNSKPVLIEANMSYGQLDFHQFCNGPIFGKNPGKIMDIILKK